MKIQESAENYLETILVLHKKMTNVRSIDIANEMGFSKPSVSEQMKKFRENELIQVDGNGYITLTEKGVELAEKVYERHEMVAQLLMDLGVDQETAYQDSCRIEHVLSDVTFDCIKKYYLSIKK
ncbi:metal-dependent transcriptional regulator [Anaerorhabdus furcosa]|uniref:Iron (Metal) dependent repressor, DtxR family n=1 Tax=Anaerorhabdus furcosa TaxID=118967 RepID=A0A1T4PQY1_9FIRM|nr:metal-dependent transcriptional regulator [Anaerorhabdus furcosa]SJZ93809.1 iron (metal) dependent repressor, DtxR family [Anaerorhabdus furcosa]